MAKLWKVVPETLIGGREERLCRSVTAVRTHPPEAHPEGSPIVRSLTCMECVLSDGSRRWFGAQDAMIGADLRMHMLPEGSACDSWEDSDPAVLGRKGGQE